MNASEHSDDHDLPHENGAAEDALADEASTDDSGLDLALAIAFAPLADTACDASATALHNPLPPKQANASPWQPGSRLAGRYEVVYTVLPMDIMGLYILSPEGSR